MTQLPTSPEVEAAMKHYMLEKIAAGGRGAASVDANAAVFLLDQFQRIREAQHKATLASLSASPEPCPCIAQAGYPCRECEPLHDAPASLPDVEAGIEKAVEAVLAHYGWKVPDYTESNVEASRQEWRYKLRLVLPYLVAPLEAKVKAAEEARFRMGEAYASTKNKHHALRKMLEEVEAERDRLTAAHQTLRGEVGAATLEMDAGKPFDAYQRLCAALNYPEAK